MLFDAHSHLDMLVQNTSNIPALLETEIQGGLGALVQVSTDPFIHNACFPFLQASGKEVYPVCGLSPAFRGHVQESLYNLNLILRQGQLFAIGEIGLDYSRSPSAADRENQGDLFRRQLELAGNYNLPVVIHTRDAAEDTLRFLDEFPAIQGMIHCFTGDAAFARALLNRGYMLSFSGVVTFANAAALREIVPWVPGDRLLVESDAPYLAPVPFRGQQNRPSWTEHTLRVIAGLRGCTFEEAAAGTAQNARRLFREQVARLPD
ncbi:MAG: TatD family hydrolase [Spirochaetota bacterium]|jgi:TatD DNase family protein|nr:TatD family hydrolase [Spirochaetota bacterium]